MDCQLVKQHALLRGGTFIPFTALYLEDIIDKQGPSHIATSLSSVEQPSEAGLKRDIRLGLREAEGCQVGEFYLTSTNPRLAVSSLVATAVD